TSNEPRSHLALAPGAGRDEEEGDEPKESPGKDGDAPEGNDEGDEEAIRRVAAATRRPPPSASRASFPSGLARLFS
ncbi:MAG TPA: hypothetical protein VGE52_09015, partial [Pirellulales bacterium]